MSQAATYGTPRKLPVWETITSGAAIGFKHFWILIAVIVVCYGLIGAFFWSAFGQMFSVLGELQKIAATSTPGDPQVVLEQQRLFWSAVHPFSFLLLVPVSIIIGSAMMVLILRIMALGPADAFSGGLGQWVYRVLLLIWRHICVVFIVFLSMIVFGIVCALGIGIGALLAKALPGVLVGLLGFLFFLAVIVGVVIFYAAMYAVAGVSFVGSSCDEGITLREAYAALKGNLLRAAGTNVLLHALLAFVISMVMMVVVIVMAATLFGSVVGGGPEAMAQAMMGGSFFITIFAIEFALIVPSIIWWYGVFVAFYRFAKGVATGSPATAAV